MFIDSSVLFAAALSARGYARDLLLAGLRGAVPLCGSPMVLEETERNLAARAPSALPAFALLRRALLLRLATPTKTQVLRAAQVVALKDAPIVAGAMRARAQYLATYDRRHLLNHAATIQAAFGIVVATPDDVLTMLGLKEGHT